MIFKIARQKGRQSEQAVFPWLARLAADDAVRIPDRAALPARQAQAGVHLGHLADALPRVK